MKGKVQNHNIYNSNNISAHIFWKTTNERASIIHTFDDFALAVSLAGLDEVCSRGVELQTVRLVSVRRLAHQDVL